MADPDALTRHLRAWLGEWPPTAPVVVTTAPARDDPTLVWDGREQPVLGVATPDALVLSVPAGAVDAVRALGDPRRDPEAVGRAVGRPGRRLFEGTFRWSTSPAPLADAGTWVDPHDDAVPEWLRPFQLVLLAVDDRGDYAAGVGVKVHDEHGWELAVGTDPQHRGGGLARRLVAQAGRRAVSEAGVATYLHDDQNHASARVADAAGFPDRGWRILGLAD